MLVSKLTSLTHEQEELGKACGAVDLNEQSIALVGEIKSQSRTNNSLALVVRVIENIYGEELEGEVLVTQKDKARPCRQMFEIGEIRIFVIETRPGNKKYTLSSSLPLALKHLAMNAKRGMSPDQCLFYCL